MPYHDGSAQGLAFSTKKLTPSIRIILKTLEAELGLKYQRSPVLTDLAYQGVLLLNCALSVKRGSPGSHMKLWEPFTDAVLAALKSKQHLVWMLWGNFAKKFIPLIPSNHLVLETVHPASTVYSGANEFNPRFTEVNKYLIEHAKKPIDWYPTEDDLPF